MGKKVFISHSSIDDKLINIFIEFLNNVGISNDDIFCTSISGSLEGGKNFVKQIKDNVKGSKMVIFLMSERFFLSYFCLAELGAAWALNQNILPVIVPPISIEEYNNTPLIGVQALNLSNVNFANEFHSNLVKKNVIANDDTLDKDKLFKEFNSEIRNEIKILRKDSRGFYIARLLDNCSRQTKQIVNQPPIDKFLLGDRFMLNNETLWRLNGLLDIESNPNINEHWILIKGIKLSSAKLKFQLGELLEQQRNQKLFTITNFYELP